MEEVTQTFENLLNDPNSIGDNITAIERFVIVTYDRTSSEVNINQARKVMFAQKGRDMDRILPTQDALLHHIKRALFQASFI